MDIRFHIGRLGGKFLALVAGCLALCSCESRLFDYEGDCSTYYKVKFRYDYNMKFADAFAHEVDYVTLYLLDETGTIVWQKTEEGEALKQEDYEMDVDVLPGTYSMLAWAGTKDKGSWNEPKAAKATELTRTLKDSRTDDGMSYMDKDIDRLFHGWLGNQEFTDLGEVGGTVNFTISLVKDTNHFMVVLQHVAGNMDMDKDDFDVYITDSNSKMNWDNTLIQAEPTRYHAWSKTEGVAGMNFGDKTKSAAFSAVIAELTMPRMLVGQKPTLTVYNVKKDEVTLSIPLIDYAMLVMGNYNKDMDKQEYLDRQDEWQMVFFLDDGQRWLDAYIYINSWRVVLQNAEL